MRTLVAVLALAVVACGDDTGSGGSGGGPGAGGAGGAAASGGNAATGGAGGAGPATPCEAICAFLDDLEAMTNCGYMGSTCIADCESGFDALPTGCDDEALAYNDCLMMQPAADYTCTASTFTLATGACDAELMALQLCN